MRGISAEVGALPLCESPSRLHRGRFARRKRDLSRHHRKQFLVADCLRRNLPSRLRSPATSSRSPASSIASNRLLDSFRQLVARIESDRNEVEQRPVLTDGGRLGSSRPLRGRAAQLPLRSPMRAPPAADSPDRRDLAAFGSSWISRDRASRRMHCLEFRPDRCVTGRELQRVYQGPEVQARSATDDRCQLAFLQVRDNISPGALEFRYRHIVAGIADVN